MVVVVRLTWTANQGNVQVSLVWIKRNEHFWWPLFMQAFHGYLLNTYDVPGTLVNMGLPRGKTEQAFALVQLTFLWKQADDQCMKEENE